MTTKTKTAAPFDAASAAREIVEQLERDWESADGGHPADTATWAAKGEAIEKWLDENRPAMGGHELEDYREAIEEAILRPLPWITEEDVARNNEAAAFLKQRPDIVRALKLAETVIAGQLVVGGAVLGSAGALTAVKAALSRAEEK